MPSNKKKDFSRLDIEEIESIDDEKELFSILLGVMCILRSDDGCAWDKQQDHRSLKRSLLEEAYETIDAIEENDPQGLKEELGDLMLQVVFHSQIASEKEVFDIRDVLKSIITKLIRRHPHVFGDTKVDGADEVLSNWEEIKKKERLLKGVEKEQDSIFKNIPRMLPALHYSYEVQTRAARLGFDWDDKEEVFLKIKEEIHEVDHAFGEEDDKKLSEEIGDLLFSIVNFSRHLGLDCEQLLKDTAKKFTRRFDLMERIAINKDLDFKSLSLSKKDILWEESKRILDEED